MFALRLFGALSLESESGPVPAGALQRRRLTLLALLGIAGERGLGRERIQAFLWPESPTDRARHALDQLLYATRRDLGVDAILSSATDLRLNSTRISCDVREFDVAMADGRWADAVASYSGPLLDGLHPAADVEFERWMERERERREQELRRALQLLAQDADSRGDRAKAAQWWRRRVDAEPLSAPATLSLMRALAVAGDCTTAVQQGRVHQRLVREILEVEPDPAVESLAQTLSQPASRTSADSAATAVGASPITLVATGVTTDPGTDEFPAAAPDRPTRWRLAASRRATVLAFVGLFALFTAALLYPARFRSSPEGFVRAEAPATDTASSGAPGGDRVMRAAQRTMDMEARQEYLRAHELWSRRTKDGLERAVVLYRQATERDPSFAPAYAGMAQAYAMLGYFGFGPADAMFPKARAAAERAITLDARSGEAYAALGQALAWEHRWRESEAAYRTALSASPDDATVHQWYALTLAYMGRARESLVHTTIASRLDPLSVQINNFHGVMLYYAGDLPASLRQFERTVIAEPDSAWVRQNPWVLDNYGHILGAAGRTTEGARLIERALKVVPRNPRALLDLAAVHARAGDTARARADFAQADPSHPHYLLYRGLFHAVLGETGEAYQWIEQVREWPLAPLIGVNNDPQYARLRADPRFARVRRSLKLD